MVSTVTVVRGTYRAMSLKVVWYDVSVEVACWVWGSMELSAECRHTMHDDGQGGNRIAYCKGHSTAMLDFY